MGSTAVLRVTALETEAGSAWSAGSGSDGPVFRNLLQGMAMEEKRQWCAEHGKRLHDEDGRICCGRRSWRVSKFT